MPAPGDLPERTSAAEDAFVAIWRSEGDDASLIDLISAAIDTRRPRLAARLVGLLSEDVPASPEIERARRAATLLLHDRETPEDRSFSELEAAWEDLRKRRIARIKHRMRAALAGSTDRVGRLGKGRRKR